MKPGPSGGRKPAAHTAQKSIAPAAEREGEDPGAARAAERPAETSEIGSLSVVLYAAPPAVEREDERPGAVRAAEGKSEEKDPSPGEEPGGPDKAAAVLARLSGRLEGIGGASAVLRAVLRTPKVEEEESEPQEGAAAILAKVPGWLKEIGSLSVALYVFGFLVVRARLNVLGVSVSLPVTDERYLTGGGVFLAETAEALFPWLFTLVFAVGVLFLSGLVLGRSARLTAALGAARERLSHPAMILVHVVVALVLSKAAHVQFSKVAGAVHLLLPDTAMSRRDALGAWILEDVRNHGHEREGLYSVLALIVLATAAALWLFRGRPPALPAAHPVLRWYLAFLLAFELLLLPVNYAVLEWDGQYPVVEVRTEPPIPGLEGRAFLLLTTDKQMVLYARGRIVDVAKASVKMTSSYCRANVLNDETCPATGALDDKREADATGAPPPKPRLEAATSAAPVDAGASDAAVVDDAGRGERGKPGL